MALQFQAQSSLRLDCFSKMPQHDLEYALVVSRMHEPGKWRPLVPLCSDQVLASTGGMSCAIRSPDCYSPLIEGFVLLCKVELRLS